MYWTTPAGKKHGERLLFVITRALAQIGDMPIPNRTAESRQAVSEDDLRIQEGVSNHVC